MHDEINENADHREYGERQEVDECARGEQSELAEIPRRRHLRHPATDRTEQPAKRIFAASRGGKDHRQPQSYREDAPRVAIGGELIDDEQRGVRNVRECGNHFAQPIADRLRPIGDHQDRVGARCGRARLGGPSIQLLQQQLADLGIGEPGNQRIRLLGGQRPQRR